MRRFLPAEMGPVPITEEMTVDEQDITRAANAAVLEAMSRKKTLKVTRSKKNFVWHPADRFKLGKIAARKGGIQTALLEARLINPKANESTMRSFAKSYNKELVKDPRIAAKPKGVLVHKKRGKPVKFGRHDQEITTYIRRLRTAGSRINRVIVKGSAVGVLTKRNATLLLTASGKSTVTDTWARSVLKRLRFKKRKGTKAARKVPENSVQLGEEYWNRIYDVKTKHNIPSCMIVAFDETASKLFPCNDWTMAEEGSKQVAIVGLEDKRAMTLGIAFSGPPCELLKTQHIYAGKTNQCHPDIDWPESSDVTHSDSHWSTETTSLRVVDNVFHPHMEKCRRALQLPDTQYGLALWDVFKSHTTQRVLDLLEARFIKVLFTPAGTTSLYAPNDHPEINHNIKKLQEDKCTKWYAEQVTRCLEENIELDVDFTTTAMKPIHARWTIETLAHVARQTQWRENAWKGTGIWPILTGTFVPNPELSLMYRPPPVATSEEAANPVPPSDYDSDYETESDAGQQEEYSGDEDEHMEFDVGVTQTPAPLKWAETLVDGDSDETQIDEPPPTSKGKSRRIVQEEGEIPGGGKLGPDTPVPKQKPASKQSAFDDMQMRIAMAASLKACRPAMLQPGGILEEKDNEGILESQSALSRDMVMNSRWRVNWLDEAWQLAKLTLFDRTSIPKKLRKHTTFASTIVSQNVQPKKLQQVPGDGACLFNCISFCLFRDTQYNRVVREKVVEHMHIVWNDTRVKLLAGLYYQDKVKKQRNVRPADVVLSVEEYVQVSKVDQPKAWAGSVELEIIAHWLRTPIKVFNLTNPKYPPSSWITYGSRYDTFDCRHILLQWSNENHYDVVLSLM